MLLRALKIKRVSKGKVVIFFKDESVLRVQTNKHI